MLVFDNVFDSLRAMTSYQLLLAFTACIGYVLVQGRLLGTLGRRLSLALAALSAVGFVALAPDWMAATMLVAFAIGGIGLFVALAWLLSGWVGLSRTAEPAPAADADAGPAPVTGNEGVATHGPHGHAHSH